MGTFGKIGGFAKKVNYFFVIVIAFCVYITFVSDYNYFRVMEYDGEIKRLKAEIKACEDSTRIYREWLMKLDSDPETLERIVREEYQMKRDNEDLYIVNE